MSTNSCQFSVLSSLFLDLGQSRMPGHRLPILLLNRNQPHCVSSAGSQLGLKVGRAIHFLLHNGNMRRRLVRIFSILVNFRGVGAAVQERKRQIDAASVPIGHASQIPFLAVTASYGDVLARNTAEHSSFIPGRRNCFDEVERRLIFVGRRTVGDHLDGRFVDRHTSPVDGPAFPSPWAPACAPRKPPW